MSARSILITGCSSGIGYHAAHALKARGWRVFATCRREADCERLRAEGLESFPLDYADETSIETALAEALPPGEHDLETLALWLAMACEAGVELQPGEEPIDTQDGNRHWRFTVPRVALDGAHLAQMDWEL